MNTAKDKNPQDKQGRSLVDRAMRVKRRANRKLSTVSGVDILGGVMDKVEKADQMIDNLPYYPEAEKTIASTLEELSDKELDDKILKTAISVACLGAFAINRKRTDLFLKNHETSTAERLFAGTMALPLAGAVVMMAIEKRRRGKSPMPDPYYVPIDEVTGQSEDIDNMSDVEIRAAISKKLEELFGE